MYIPGLVFCTQLACTVGSLPPGKGFADIKQCEAVAVKLIEKVPEAPYIQGGCFFVSDSWKPTPEALQARIRQVFAPPNLREDTDG